MAKSKITLTPDIYFANVCPTLNMNIRSELYSTNEFTFAVAVILSAQATDKKVNEVTPELFRIAPTPDKMLELGLDGLKKHIRVISFFNNKAENIIKLSQQLKAKNSDDVNYKFPKKYHNRNELMKLAGVGQKTANVVMSEGFKQDAFAVDTHVLKVSNRLGIVKTKNPDECEIKLKKFFPKNKWSRLHYQMVLFGRYICKAQRPDCKNCVFNTKCKESRI